MNPVRHNYFFVGLESTLIADLFMNVIKNLSRTNCITNSIYRMKKKQHHKITQKYKKKPYRNTPNKHLQLYNTIQRWNRGGTEPLYCLTSHLALPITIVHYVFSFV